MPPDNHHRPTTIGDGFRFGLGVMFSVIIFALLAMAAMVLSGLPAMIAEWVKK